MSEEEIKRKLAKEIREKRKYEGQLYPHVERVVESLKAIPDEHRGPLALATIATIVKFVTKNAVEALGLVEAVKSIFFTEIQRLEGMALKLWEEGGSREVRDE